MQDGLNVESLEEIVAAINRTSTIRGSIRDEYEASELLSRL